MKRLEDDPLLRGAGRYTSDTIPPGALVGRFYRSPVAHADIAALDLGAARAVPGVAAVFTMDDLADVLPGAPGALDALCNRDGSPAPAPARSPLARGRVRFAGEPIALIVGGSAAAVDDAIELIVADFDERPIHLALAPGGAVLHDGAPDNVALDWAYGDTAAMDAVFAGADHVVTAEIVVPRIHGAPLEPMAAIADFDPVAGHWTLVTPTQGAHRVRDELATHFLQVDPARLRVVTPDVGGAFGLRIHALSEQAVLLAAAARLGCAVAWTASRLEAMGCEPHSRDYKLQAALALDARGMLLGLRADACFSVGAYVFPGSRTTPTGGLLFGLQGPYRLPSIVLRARGIYGNTTPTGPFRGAGQPEGTYVMERLLDLAAHRLAIDPVALRQRNLLRPEAFPYQTASGATVDSGNPAGLLATAIDLAGPAAEVPAGRLGGRGIALYMKMNGMGRREDCTVTLDRLGQVQVRVGSQSNGQGHATAYAQITAACLGVAIGRITILQGDTAVVASGTGTGASSALQTTGSGVLLGARDLVARARLRAAVILGCDATALFFAAGLFHRPASNQTLSLAELAALDGVLTGAAAIEVSNSFTMGCHICDVTVDPQTGAVAILRYAAVDDLGQLINATIAQGQIHGGLAQGLGQALLEAQCYEPASGQPLTLSFMDFAIPRAADIPVALVTGFQTTPTDRNALGVRGAGEAGAMAGMAAIVNAVADALRPLGVTRIDAPLTPNAVWDAITAAGGSKAGVGEH